METQYIGTYMVSSIITSTNSPNSNKCEVPNFVPFDTNLGQHLIVIVFSGI